MSNNSQLRGTPFSVTAAGTTSAQAATTGTSVRYYVTDISGTSTGTAGTWVILGGTTGSTVFWQGSGAVTESFVSPIETGSSGTISFYMNGATLT